MASPLPTKALLLVMSAIAICNTASATLCSSMHPPITDENSCTEHCKVQGQAWGASWSRHNGDYQCNCVNPRNLQNQLVCDKPGPKTTPSTSTPWFTTPSPGPTPKQGLNTPAIAEWRLAALPCCAGWVLLRSS